MFTMFTHQPFASSSFFKESIDAQMSLFAAISKGFFDTSVQIGALSTQAVQNVMDTTCANFQRGMQLPTVADMNPFFGQQLWAPFGLLSAWLPANMDAAPLYAAARPATPDQPAAAAEGSAARETAGPGAHDVPPKPSTLVEKMIASVVEDTTSPDKKS